MNPPDVVLGIDPGVSRCGYGAVAADGSSLVALACGVIRTPPSDPLPERLAALQIELEHLVTELAPAAVAVERVFFQTNVRTAMSVGQASGLALALAARAGIPVSQYTPNEVKQAVAGYGAAGKEQVQLMVTRLLNLAEVPKPPDAADALALAICHLSAGRFRTAAGLAGDRSGSAAPGTVPGLARAIAAATGRGATGSVSGPYGAASATGRTLAGPAEAGPPAGGRRIPTSPRPAEARGSRKESL